MRHAMVQRILTAVLLTAGCTAPSLSRTDVAPQLPPDATFARFASDIAFDAPGTELVSAPAGTCGPGATPVVRVPFADANCVVLPGAPVPKAVSATATTAALSGLADIEARLAAARTGQVAITAPRA